MTDDVTILDTPDDPAEDDPIEEVPDVRSDPVPDDTGDVEVPPDDDEDEEDDE